MGGPTEEEIDKQFAAVLTTISAPAKDSQKVSLSNNDKLKFYALFKQATVGPCTTPQPSRMKVVERAKHDAWKKLGQTSQLEAKKQMIAEFAKIMPNAKL